MIYLDNGMSTGKLRSTLSSVNKKSLLVFGAVLVISALLLGISYAAFSDKGDVRGTTITVGSSDIKLLQNVALGAVPENLVDELQGPRFENIGQTWIQDYLVKVFNNAPGLLDLSTSANYETANDPTDLRGDINVELFEWEDTDSDGVVGEGELGQSIGKKTITKWKTEGFSLGQMQSGQIKGLVIRFSATNLASSKQGAQILFDFSFNAVEVE